MSTHYVGSDPNRVVLGRWAGDEAGYIGEARGSGGIFYSTGDDTWNAMVRGLDEDGKRNVAWQVNEYFLRNQMERGVPRIEYVLPAGRDSVEAVARMDPASFSAMEINFLKQNAASFGYKREGNAWVYAGK